MNWLKLNLTVTMMATLGVLCFAACDSPAELQPESELTVRSLHVANKFELDGNPQDDGATPGDDWQTIHLNGGSATDTTGILPDGNGATIFTGGGSKDTVDLGSWRHTNGSVPDKNNITNAYAASYENGDLLIYFGADRYATSGDAFLGFWFFQQAVEVLPNGTFGGQHQEGDLLVLVNFNQGGSTPNVQVLEWDTSAPNNLKQVFAQNVLCDATNIDQHVCAITNSASTGSDWPYTPKSGAANTFAPGAFFEGGINLNKVFANAVDVPCFASFLAETRASTSVSATLKDFVIGSFQVCNPEISVTATCTPELDWTDGVNVVVNYQGQVCNPSGGITGVDLSSVVVSAYGDDIPLGPVKEGQCVPFEGSFLPTYSPYGASDPGQAQFTGTVTAKGTASIGSEEVLVETDGYIECGLCPG